MDVLLHVARHVEVDDVLHVGDVEATGGDGRGYDDRGLATLEPSGGMRGRERGEGACVSPEGLLPLSLGAVSMDAGDGEALAVEELVQRVGASLRLHEHQGTGGLGKGVRCWTQKTEQSFTKSD